MVFCFKRQKERKIKEKQIHFSSFILYKILFSCFLPYWEGGSSAITLPISTSTPSEPPATLYQFYVPPPTKLFPVRMHVSGTDHLEWNEIIFSKLKIFKWLVVYVYSTPGTSHPLPSCDSIFTMNHPAIKPPCLHSYALYSAR